MAEVGSTSMPCKALRRETRASAKPRHTPWSSEMFPTVMSGRTTESGALGVRRRGVGGGVVRARRSVRRVARIDYFYRADETVAFADDGFEEARFGGVVAEGGANFSDDVVDVLLGVDEEVGAPEAGDDVLTRNELVPAGDEENQQLHGLFFEADWAAALAKLVATEVEFEVGSWARGGWSHCGMFARGWRFVDRVPVFPPYEPDPQKP